MTAALAAMQSASGNITASVLSLSSDIFAMGAIFAILLALGIWKGQGTLAALALALMIGTTFETAFPYHSIETASPYLPIAVFVVLVGIAFYVLLGIVSVYSAQSGVGEWLKTALLAALTTTLFVAITYHVISIAPIYVWSGILDHVFKPETYFFWWLIAPLAVIYFI
jgi:hypothetical protein